MKSEKKYKNRLLGFAQNIQEFESYPNHYKMNRANSDNTSEDEYEVKNVPINLDFEELLYEMGYEEKKGTDEYILAPEETCEREQMMRIISSAFTHYFKHLKTGDVKNFKYLRKTYATEMVVLLGDGAPAVTKQRLDTIMKYYYGKGRMMQVLRENFKALGKIFNDKKRKKKKKITVKKGGKKKKK